MIRNPLASALLAWAVTAHAAAPPTLTSLRAIHALSNPEASHLLPVAFEATVTYFRPFEKTLFVQDGDLAIFVLATTDEKLVPGDRVLIKGSTQPSFRPIVVSNDITLLRHGSLPNPATANFDELIRAKFDCRRVTVRGRVRAADVTTRAAGRSAELKLNSDGGEIDVTIDSDDQAAVGRLLDADVEVSGAEAGQFDGKMQQTGVLIHAESLADVKVLRSPAQEPWSIPEQQMDEVLTNYHVNDLTRRVRVRGTITYYEPGAAVVLQSGAKSLWIMTQSDRPLHIGRRADAIGYPTVHDGFLTLTGGEIKERDDFSPVKPQKEEVLQLTSSRHIFDLVSVDATVVAAVREATQDKYILASGAQLFSATYRHTTYSTAGPAQMKEIPLGSRVRATGICIAARANPFNGQVPFDLLMRSYDDIAVIARPSPLNVRTLSWAVGSLLLIVLAVSAWGWTMKAKVRRQTAALAVRIEAEAALERRMAKLELGRSRILEDINGSRPLAEIMEQIVELASFRLNGARCWCELAGGVHFGSAAAKDEPARVVEMPIVARSGPAHGIFSIAFGAASAPDADEQATLSAATKLTALAIETRHLYADLRHRSEFDQLTNIHNRFSLEKYLDQLVEESHANAAVFALIYVDLNDFKQVNDVYGHRAGDLYLQEAASRMKRQLRSADMLARLGGDEFAAVLPLVGNRAQAEEVALRLARSFDDPFAIEGYKLEGSASIGIAMYPEDGATRDSLLSAADAAMYVAKHTRKQMAKSVNGKSARRTVRA